jgi:hypothetical protein
MDHRRVTALAWLSSEYSGLHLHCSGCTPHETGRRQQDMNSVTSSWRRRRQAARTRRALDRALARTSSPAMRDELLTMANSSGFTL